MNLLLISNSTNAGEPFLAYPLDEIRKFFAANGVTNVLFVPYAAVTFSFDEYEHRVRERFAAIGVEVDSVHHYLEPAEAVQRAQAIVVGGGNTFRLLRLMQENGLTDLIASRVIEEGLPYVGWSAGSNVACPTLCTTNDMPIVEPLSFNALNLVPFQINPHYTDAHPTGHAGETRSQRIEEYIVANPYMYVLGLRESCMLRVTGKEMELIGPHPARLFKHGLEPRELHTKDELAFLLER